MKFNILTYDNRVGIVTDAFLLKVIIEDEIIENVNVQFINNNIQKSDIGIWIQNFEINLLNRFKKNVFFINEEWSGEYELNNLNLFDYVICKSKYAYDLLINYTKFNKNIIYLPFISRNFFNKNVLKDKKYLHFMGRSIQKNTELILDQNVDITLIDPDNRYNPNQNFNHINSYQTNDQLQNVLNSHNIHICCSLYESWGHYLFEGMSTGAEIICSDIPVFKEQLDPDLVHFIPTQEKIDASYLYCSDNINNKFMIRKSFFVNKNYFKNYIENFKPIGKNQERTKLFNYIMHKNKISILNFLKNI
jgi:glycosyltransferase involved in cell wall biosynthesis